MERIWNFTDIFSQQCNINDNEYGIKHSRKIFMKQVAPNVFTPPKYLSPNRWGYNIIQLFGTARQSKIKFKGIEQQAYDERKWNNRVKKDFEPEESPSPFSDWRWGIVSVDENSNVKK